MKRVFFFLPIAVVSLLVFQRTATSEPPPAPAVVLRDPGPAQLDDAPKYDASRDGIMGYYVGSFGPNKITIRIEKAVGDSVLGFSVVAGNERAFSGRLERRGPYFFVTVNEPGDAPHDGRFEFLAAPKDGTLTGTWVAYDKGIASIQFSLKRRDFKYAATSGKYPQASTRLLKTRDVENIQPDRLRVMRNEIYARHGYSFKMKDMRNYFDAQGWYMPMATNVSTRLTATEQQNETLIKRYEQYGAEYYDSFGR